MHEIIRIVWTGPGTDEATGKDETVCGNREVQEVVRLGLLVVKLSPSRSVVDTGTL